MVIKKDKIYLVYRLISPENRSYIGITSHDVKTRLYKLEHEAKKGASKPISRAIRIFGAENFEKETLFTGLSAVEACLKEVEIIKQYNSVYPGGYNLAQGGEGVAGTKHTEKTREILSELTKKQWSGMSEEQRKKQVKTFYEKGHAGLIEKFEKMTSEELAEFKQKVSKGCREYWKSETGRAKLKEMIPNRKMSEESKRGMIEKLHEYRNDPETRQKFLKSVRARSVICIETSEKFECVKTAEKNKGCFNIHAVLKGKRPTAGGYHWKYAEVAA